MLTSSPILPSCGDQSPLFRHHVDAIDGLRGVAILMVVYQHTLATSVGRLVTSNGRMTFPYIVTNGWMGVGLFFMLSGFVLALPYFSQVRTMDTASDIFLYYRHRALRLLPLFVFMAFVSLLFGAVRGFDYSRSLALVLSTASMFTTTDFFPKLNGSLLSLMVEIWFCVLFPFIMISLQRYRFAASALPIMAIALGLRVMGAYFPFADPHTNPVKDFFLARTDDFFVGMVLACCHAKQLLPRDRAGWTFAAGWLTIASTAFMWDLSLQGVVPKYTVASFNNLSQLGFGLVMISVLQPGWPNACHRLWGLRVLGAMCFSVYCWHSLLVTNALRRNPFDWTLELQFWFLLLLLSSLTYRFIEFPYERSFAKLFRFESVSFKQVTERFDEN